MDSEFVARAGTRDDLPLTYALAERGLHAVGLRMGVVPPGSPPDDAEIAARWAEERPLFEFFASLPGRYRIIESRNQIVAFARVAAAGGVENLTELFVDEPFQGRGLAGVLLATCWPDQSSRRLIVAAGANADLTTYIGIGTVPLAGHWNMTATAATYVDRRVKEPDAAAHLELLEPDRAQAEWQRLEPLALGHARPELHRHLSDRTCLAAFDPQGRVESICWISRAGAIGPGVGRDPEALVRLVIAVLDREAATGRDALQLFVPTVNAKLLLRLRGLGFRLAWPGWIMGSFPLPGLDRYVPTCPSWIL